MATWFKNWSSTSRSRFAGPSWSLRMKIQELMNIDDFAGLLVRLALLAGLQKEELMSMHRMQICTDKSPLCDCRNVHIMSGPNNIVVLSFSGLYPTNRGRAILPHALWRTLKSLDRLTDEDFDLADSACRIVGVRFNEIPQIYRIVQSNRIDLDYEEFLTRFKAHEIHIIAVSYCSEWKSYGLDFPLRC